MNRWLPLQKKKPTNFCFTSPFSKKKSNNKVFKKHIKEKGTKNAYISIPTVNTGLTCRPQRHETTKVCVVVVFLTIKRNEKIKENKNKPPQKQTKQ